MTMEALHMKSYTVHVTWYLAVYIYTSLFLKKIRETENEFVRCSTQETLKSW